MPAKKKPEEQIVVRAVVAGKHGPGAKPCFYVIVTMGDMWGMNVVPLESCPRVLRRLWGVSEALSEAMLPYLKMLYDPLERPPEEVESLHPGTKILRLHGVDVLHYVDSDGARAAMPIIRQLLFEDPAAVAEILNRLSKTATPKTDG